MEYTVVEISGDGVSKNGQKFWKATIKDESGKAYDVYVFKNHLKEGDKIKGEIIQRESRGKTFLSFKLEKEPKADISEILKEIRDILKEIREQLKNG